MMPIELPDYQPSPDEAYMNPRQVAYFRRKLEQARADLRHELDEVPHIEPDETARDGDQTDHASADTDREFAILNRARIQALLHQTETALTRLDNGTYGYCDDTGEPIGLKRLIAQPATSLSLAAQEAREQRAG